MVRWVGWGIGISTLVRGIIVSRLVIKTSLIQLFDRNKYLGGLRGIGGCGIIILVSIIPPLFTTPSSSAAPPPPWTKVPDIGGRRCVVTTAIAAARCTAAAVTEK